MTDSIVEETSSEMSSAMLSKSIASEILNDIQEGSVGSTLQEILAALTAINANLTAGKRPVDQHKVSESSEGGEIQSEQFESSRVNESKGVRESVKLDPRIVEEFCQCIFWKRLKRLLKMLDEHPVQLILRGWDELWGTALHVAVSQRSKELFAKLDKGLWDLWIEGGVRAIEV